MAFKPPATIGQPQPTSTYAGRSTVLEARGRHDPCVVPRALPIVEAMAALVLMDALVEQAGRYALAHPLPALLPGSAGEKAEASAETATSGGQQADGDEAATKQLLMLTGGGWSGGKPVSPFE